tara:strand:+ start:546 stop:1844 length:1299 start_codon:yes stop_codon:yes gene_type:complete
VNKLLFTLIIFLLINNCSFNENSKIWENKEKKINKEKNIKKVFEEKNRTVSEFNKNLKLNLSKISTNNKINKNLNNVGSQHYEGKLNKAGNFKFSKIQEIDQLNFKPLFLTDGIIYFNKKGTIIKYNNNQKILWKKNYYSKAEKKLNPKLNFIIDDKNLLIADSISKYYSINTETGELNWSKYNIYPFNSEIKKYEKNFFVVDYKNTLRCFKISDGSECWNLKTEDTFTISSSKYSLIVVNEKVIFSNSIGDITSVDINTGLINWQLPTQSNDIVYENFTFKNSKIVSDNNTVFFSNNKNQFYSLDLKTGIPNWINKVNSNLTPIIIENLIFTVSNEGYLYVIEKSNGNILRVSDLLKDFKYKKRVNIKTKGFIIGDNKLYLTISNGYILKVNLETGNVIQLEKASNKSVSKPYIFNKNLFIVRNGSIIKYD